MKAKNIFRISFLALLLCMMTMLGAMADEATSTPLDAKIIRWDGMGNVDMDSYNIRYPEYLSLSETDGILRVTGGYDKPGITNATARYNYFYINLSEDEYITLKDYPYYVIKYKTNEGYSTADFTDGAEAAYTEALLYVTDNESGKITTNSYYHTNYVRYSGYDLVDMWQTYLFSLTAEQTGFFNKITATNPPSEDNDVKLWRIEIRPAKNLAQFDSLAMDIEYIGFFKNEQDARNYGRSSVQILPSSSEDRTQIKSESATVSNDVFDVTLATNTDLAAGPVFHLFAKERYNLPDNRFYVDNYKYGTFSIKSGVDIPIFQLYHLYNSEKNYSVYYEPANKKLQYSDTFSKFDFEVTTADTPRLHENPNNQHGIFMQMKGFGTSLTTSSNAQIQYIAYFKTEDDRTAFSEGKLDTVKSAYKAVANVRKGLVVENATNAEDLVKSKVDAALTANNITGITAKYSTTIGTGSCKVVVTLSPTGTGNENYYAATKTVGFDVEVKVKVKKELDAKIIRFDGNGTVTATVSDSQKQITENAKDGILRIDMPAGSIYNRDATSEPTFEIAENNRFLLKEYPYVKIKMRTNYSTTIQFYVGTIDTANKRVLNRYDVSNSTRDGDWHIYEMAFLSKDQSTYKVANYISNEYTVAKPFFQLKSPNKTPDGDLFAEIEYIGYFKNEADMKAYGKNADDSKVFVNGNQLKNNVFSDSVKFVDSDVDDVLRIKTINAVTTVDIMDVIRTADGNKVDLYEYPYANIRFRTNYTKDDIQFYLMDGTNLKFYVNLKASITADGNTWYNATVSFKNSERNIENKVVFNLNGYDWTTIPLNSNNFPSKIGELSFDDLKFQLKNGVQENGFLDIAYIAFYKNKEAMLNDDTYNDEYVAAIDSAVNTVKTALNSAQGLSFTLHPAIGEIALENYVREIIEAENPDVSVAAKAVSFNRNAPTCDVEITVYCGLITKTATVSVDLSNNDFTLETLGAQIRNKVSDNIPDGLRFGTKFAYDENIYTIVEYGTLLSPVGNTAATYQNKLEKASVTPAYYSGSRYFKENDTIKYFEAADVKVDVNNSKFYTFDGTIYQIFTAVLYDINDETRKAADIIARPYVTYKLVGDKSGKEFTYYGTEITRSWNTVKAAVDAGTADTEVKTDSKWSND